ncbi:WapI family immunity protein [Kordia sp.]|uniref:WapI family immunity protein n=1 Tax=Kordia sp. TaxID=1965332 RepID=UPI003B598142
MIFKGLNHKHIDFSLEYFDQAELTGFYTQLEITGLSLYLQIEDALTMTSILVSEVEKIINWFEKLLLNEPVEPRLLTMNDQFYFDLVENNSDSKLIRITHDNTVPVPGVGGYSLAPGTKKEDFFKKVFVDCEMNSMEIERVVKKLRAELDIEMEIGWKVESKRPKWEGE